MPISRDLHFKIEKALESIKIIYEFKEKEVLKGTFINSGILLYKNYKSKLNETIVSGNSILVSTTYNPLGAIWVLNYYRVLEEPTMLYTSRNDLNAEWINASREVIDDIIAQHILLGIKPKKIKIKQLIKLVQAIL